ncbi:MAG: hypothetical protein ACYCOS_04530 [Sulfobacillus sp.]
MDAQHQETDQPTTWTARFADGTVCDVAPEVVQSARDKQQAFLVGPATIYWLQPGEDRREVLRAEARRIALEQGSPFSRVLVLLAKLNRITIEAEPEAEQQADDAGTLRLEYSEALARCGGVDGGQITAADLWAAEAEVLENRPGLTSLCLRRAVRGLLPAPLGTDPALDCQRIVPLPLDLPQALCENLTLQQFCEAHPERVTRREVEAANLLGREAQAALLTRWEREARRALRRPRRATNPAAAIRDAQAYGAVEGQ